MKKLLNKRLCRLLFLALLAALLFSLGVASASDTYGNTGPWGEYPVMQEPPYNLEEIQRNRVSLSYQALALPAAIDRTADYPRPGNQGSQNSCTAWAVAYAYKTMQDNLDHGWGVAGVSPQFSPAFVYNQINGGTDNGSGIGTAMQLLMDKGCCTLADMPYSDRDYRTQPNAGQLASAYPHRSASFWSLSGTNEIKNAIYSTGGAVIGIPVYNDFYAISPSNQV